MAEMFREFALTIKPFTKTHGFRVLLNLVYKGLNFIQTTRCIGLNSLTKLPDSQLHIMEVGYRFTQFFVYIAKH